MTITTVRPIGRPDSTREQHIAAGHHGLAFCEFCDQPVAGPLADCPAPDCQRRVLDRDRLFEQRCEDLDHNEAL